MRPSRRSVGPGQESVWDYPRPPRIEPASRRIRLLLDGEVIADSTRAQRVLETSHAPVYYLPPADIRMEVLVPSPHRSHCEWKGEARYLSLRLGAHDLPDVAWCYPAPMRPFLALEHHLAFYLEPLAGLVDEERARPQPGRFYGGWVTNQVVGPFKGEPGTSGW